MITRKMTSNKVRKVNKMFSKRNKIGKETSLIFIKE